MVTVLVTAMVCASLTLWWREATPRRFGERDTGSMPGAMSWAATTRIGFLLATVGAVLVGRPGVAVLLALGALTLWREVERRRAQSVAARRVEALGRFVGSLVVAVRGGRSLGVAVVEAETASSVGVEVADRVRAGWPVVAALDEVLGVDGEDERLVCVTVRALESTGASASDAMDRVVEALSERQSGREEARTQAQQALSSSLVLSVLPLVFGAGVATVEPAVARLYVSSWLGAACLGSAGALSLAGWEWQQRLLRSVVT